MSSPSPPIVPPPQSRGTGIPACVSNGGLGRGLALLALLVLGLRRLLLC